MLLRELHRDQPPLILVVNEEMKGKSSATGKEGWREESERAER